MLLFENYTSEDRSFALDVGDRVSLLQRDEEKNLIEVEAPWGKKGWIPDTYARELQGATALKQITIDQNRAASLSNAKPSAPPVNNNVNNNTNNTEKPQVVTPRSAQPTLVPINPQPTVQKKSRGFPFSKKGSKSKGSFIQLKKDNLTIIKHKNSSSK